MRPVAVEQALVAHLRAALGVHVGTRVPSSRPARFVVVSRAGGQRRNLVQSDVRVLVECWATTDTDAWATVRGAWAAVDALDGVEMGPDLSVSRLSLTEPVNYPDEISGSPRYQFLATLTVNLEG